MNTTCKRARCTNKARRRGYCAKHAKLTQPAPTTREECQQVINHLLAQGWTEQGLSKAAGLQPDTIRLFTSGTNKTLRRNTLTRLQNLNKHPKFVPSWPITRRLQALVSIGIPVKEIATNIEVGDSQIREWLRGEFPRISRLHAQNIRDYYQANQMRPVTEPAPKYRSKGWAPPLAWDDIDNPDCTPTEYHQEPKRLPRERKNTALLQQRARTIAQTYGLKAGAELLKLPTGRLRAIKCGDVKWLSENEASRITHHYKRLPAHNPNQTGQAA
ncbi:hypothetical protein H0194_04765 [Corynebacterium incognita]|uniref:Uncharacterized protein n=1 Tax=Corynebacterium incognita TaxID=2754725 RepID=A0A7G7CRS6_9CORY|nr:hypothetical protein [Corynebacterium incognita]QNE90292.1 hypothetical protein H0194_04765 [Corynebacterium incognita]